MHKTEAKVVYLDYYGLREAPFSITPDPEFLFASGTHQSVLDRIIYGIENWFGFILLVGEVGTGKTTICRSILDRLENRARTVLIINPAVSGKELISGILHDLKVTHRKDASKKELIDCLNRFLIKVADDIPVVVIIDDAQAMPFDALEDLRLLSNLETDKKKLLQIVLAGQPELAENISRRELRQLKQRISIDCRLDVLSKNEIEGYIRQRLYISGDNGRICFNRRAVSLIFRLSNGIPRLINKLCDYALTAGYITNDHVIGRRHVKKAEKELFSPVFKNNFFKSAGLQASPGRMVKYWPVLLFLIILPMALCWRDIIPYTILSAKALTKQEIAPWVIKNQYVVDNTKTGFYKIPDQNGKNIYSKTDGAKKFQNQITAVKQVEGEKNWVIQVASLKKSKAAAIMVAELQNKGFQAFTQKKEVPGKGVRHRIRIGYFKDIDQARLAQTRLKSLNYQGVIY